MRLGRPCRAAVWQRVNNDSWAYRRLLLRGARHLSDKQWRRLTELFAIDDPTGEIQSAWAGKELLRQLLDALPAVDGPLVTDPRRDPAASARPAGPGLRPYELRARLDRFYRLAAETDVPELSRLAATVETCCVLQAASGQRVGVPPG